jgi:hypothetical protein
MSILCTAGNVNFEVRIKSTMTSGDSPQTSFICSIDIKLQDFLLALKYVMKSHSIPYILISSSCVALLISIIADFFFLALPSYLTYLVFDAYFFTQSGNLKLSHLIKNQKLV